MTDDDLPDVSFFRFEKSLYDLTRPLDDLDHHDDDDTFSSDDGDVYVDPDADPDDCSDDEWEIDSEWNDGDDDEECSVDESKSVIGLDADSLDDTHDLDDMDLTIDDLIRSILDDAAASPRRPTPPRFVDVTDRTTAARRARGPVLADRLLQLVYSNLEGVSIMIASTAPGTGAYARLTIDPLHSIEVRFFGWARLQPHSDEPDYGAIEAMRRLGFTLDDGDWVWRVATQTTLIPVAAHVAQRALAEAWSVRPHEATERHIRLFTLDGVQMMLIASGLVCSWCADGECPGASTH